MDGVYAVLGLALLQFMVFGGAVGWARGKYSVPAPATTGHAIFERYFRVQMNTLELLIVFVPALPLFAYFVSVPWAIGLGLTYLAGRTLYFLAYVKEPKGRGLGFMLSWLPTVALLVGGLVGACMKVLAAR